MIILGLSVQEQVTALVRQWVAQGEARRAEGEYAEAKLEWVDCPEGVSRPEAIYRLQKKIKEEKAHLVWEEESSKTLTGWQADYADWYWASIEETQRCERAAIQERRGMIEALRNLK